MKTGKSIPKKTDKMPHEVKQYLQSVDNFRAAYSALNKLKTMPVVKEYLGEQEEPVKTEQEKRQEELNSLYDKFFDNWNFIHTYLHIISELSHKSVEVTIDEIYGMLIEIDKRMWPMRAGAGRVFQLNGIVKEDEMSAEQIESEMNEDSEE